MLYFIPEWFVNKVLISKIISEKSWLKLSDDRIVLEPWFRPMGLFGNHNSFIKWILNFENMKMNPGNGK